MANFPATQQPRAPPPQGNRRSRRSPSRAPARAVRQRVAPSVPVEFADSTGAPNSADAVGG
eukprot:566082-Alexandrium_andersonii.AAC.1